LFRSIKATKPSGLLGGCYFETLNGTPSLLNAYEIASTTLSFVPAAGQNVHIASTTTAAPVVQTVLVGNQVTVTFTSQFSFTTDSTSQNSAVMGTALPVETRPITNIAYTICIGYQNCTNETPTLLNSSPVAVNVWINPNGIMTFVASAGAGAVFTVSKAVVFPVGTTFTYAIY
jgi:hypothetical protein